MAEGNGSGNGGGSMSVASAALAPPHNLEAEQSVLGAVLLSDRAMYRLVIDDGLRAEHFYRDRHRSIYSAMLSLYDRSEPVDAITVTEHLRQTGELEGVGGAGGVQALVGAVEAPGNVRHYAGIVRDNALLRRLLNTAYEIQANVHGREGAPRDLVEWAEKAMLEVGQDDRQKDFQRIDDVLHRELEKLHKLSTEGASMTGTPSGFKDLDEITGGFQPGNLIVLAARPSMGKCLPGHSVLHDPMTGQRVRIADVVSRHETGEEVWVSSLGPDLRIQPARVSATCRSGVKRVFRLTTRLGRKLDATANHPLLTITGWRPLEDLAAGARIAVPRVMHHRGRNAPLPDHEIVLLAAHIADGVIARGTPRFTCAANSPVRAAVERAADQIGARQSVHRHRASTNVAISLAHRSGDIDPVTAVCRRHGIWGKRSEEKFVPDAIFSLDERQIARFLSVLYACDGRADSTGRLRQIGYSTVGERVARDVQHLLLRLGIVSCIRKLKRAVHEGTEKHAYEVRMTNQQGLGAFCELIKVVGKEAREEVLLDELVQQRVRTNVDTVPAAARPQVLAGKGAGPRADVSERTGRPRSHYWHVGSRGLSRSLLGELADAFDDEALDMLATSEIWWDEVESIEPIGEHETFDLEIPGLHNFVADDLIVHNSALVTNIAENAALDHGRPVALFSLEMSEAELSQRFLASQAKIKGEDLRKGRLTETKWPKILAASEKLSRAPLYVDDSSDLGIMEVRAKARRLHSQTPGGLGLVIVDYLQLMRADERIESRVQQVGQMSRGLKILARELDVPVIALSQLSRAVEQRGGEKIPILSDLRESGNLEQDADAVIFIYREEYYEQDSEREGEADLIIAKHRNGPIGRVVLTFHKEYPKFMNFAGERFS